MGRAAEEDKGVNYGRKRCRRVCVEEMERQAKGSFLWQQLANNRNKRTNEGNKKGERRQNTSFPITNIDLPFSCYFCFVNTFVRCLASLAQSGGGGEVAVRGKFETFVTIHSQAHSNATPATQPHGLVGPPT